MSWQPHQPDLTISRSHDLTISRSPGSQDDNVTWWLVRGDDDGDDQEDDVGSHDDGDDGDDGAGDGSSPW